jgi:hypothetical protein
VERVSGDKGRVGVNAELEWLKAVPTSFVGDEYESFVKLLTVVVMAAFAGKILVGLLLRPPMSALAQQAWSLLKEVDGALKHGSQYGPEVERVRQRIAPYFFFVLHMVLFAVASGLYLLGLYAIAFSVRPGLPWYSAAILSLLMCGVLWRWRLEFAFASWQWHAIKTGEGRPPRRPQAMA